MKTVIFSLIFAALIISPVLAQKPSRLPSEEEKISYSIGLNIGRNLKRQKIEVDTEWIAIGMKDALEGKGQLLSNEEVSRVMKTFQEKQRQKAMAAHRKAGESNRQEGKDFLTKNGKRKEVTTTESGLQFEVMRKGTGKSPKASDTVQAHYKGTLINGNEFDSSYKRGQPASFPLNRVIPGWTEALQLMKVGGKWKVWIPYELAYGEEGRPPAIPPASALVFEIELLGIQ